MREDQKAPGLNHRNHQEKHLTVHMIPHTHDDVGWLKTYDDYFTGLDDDIYHAKVDQILTTVVEQLLLDPKKVFTYVEMKFFSMWFERQTEKMQ